MSERSPSRRQQGLVLYIAGYGRSGSTLLDAILSSQPGWCGLGEATYLFDNQHSDQCSCGRALVACPVWSSTMSNLSPTMVHRRTRRAERLSGGPWLPSPQRRRYADIWNRLPTRIDGHGVRVLVDSSKTSRMSFWRPYALRSCGYRVKVVHLVRHPLHVMASLHAGSNRKLESGGDNPRLPGGAWRALLGWVFTNVLVECLTIFLRRDATLRVRYDDLMRDPGGTLARIESLIGLPLDEARRRVLEGMPLAVGHGVSGNRMRRQDGGITFSPRIGSLTVPRQWVLATWLCAAPLMIRYKFHRRST